jgi:ribokinase
VDTTAAGDTFTGYFIASILQEKPVPEALKLAAKASAIAVSREGAVPSIPTLDEVMTCSI